MINDNESDYAKFLYNKGYIKAPQICKCGSSVFNIYKDSGSKTSQCIFRCTNAKCKNRVPIRTNSFFNAFPKIKLRLVSEIIKSFFEEMNCTECYKYLTKDLLINISLDVITRIYSEIRTVLTKYYNILYQSEILGMKDCHFCSESLFSHTDNEDKIWVLGIIDNQTKDFRLNISLKRDQNVLKSFITIYVELGNTIITDGWSDYNFLGSMDNYSHDIHIHRGGFWPRFKFLLI